MAIFSFLLGRKEPTAAIAKERLQIVLAHERSSAIRPDFLPQLQRDLIAVVSKYVEVGDNDIRVNFDKSSGTSLLEIDIEFDPTKAHSKAATD